MNFLLLVNIFICLTKAEVYISFTNNTGTYVNRIPDNPEQLSHINNSPPNSNYTDGKHIKDNENEFHITNSQRKVSVVDVPVMISTLNVNNHSGKKSIQNQQHTGYSFEGSKCVSCDSDEKPASKPFNPPSENPEIKPWTPPKGTSIPKPTPPTVDESRCCYLSKKRICTLENEKHTCRTKVERACGDRCTNHASDEEAYFINDSDIANLFTVKKSHNKKTTHPYARVPVNQRHYPGRKAPIPGAYGLHGSRQHRRGCGLGRKGGCSGRQFKGYGNDQELQYYRNPAHVPYIGQLETAYPQMIRPSFGRRNSYRNRNVHYRNLGAKHFRNTKSYVQDFERNQPRYISQYDADYQEMDEY